MRCFLTKVARSILVEGGKERAFAVLGDGICELGQVSQVKWSEVK